VYLDTVGCRLNQAEIESMACEFRAAGHEVVATAGDADMAVVNTCTVTADAAAASRALIRRLTVRGAGSIVATGCWATLRRSEALAMPGVLRVIPNAIKSTLVGAILGSEDVQAAPQIHARRPIPGARHRTRDFIKAQDGCDNHCTFCLTTIARGGGQSHPCPQVIAEVRSALRGGVKEIVLAGVHLGSWGAELGLHLKDLVHTILRETDIPRLRLSSLEPWDLDEDFFRLWEDRRMCRSLHLPLQSGCAATLRRMGRRTTPDSFRALVHVVRSQFPDVAITTDVIAGFPGETQDEFRTSLDIVREMEFAGGHAFTYSPMAGTAAVRMGGQVPLATRRQRTGLYLMLIQKSSEAFRAT
jgi:threonylcarbamoyladenosine tRNA methylthiotransferase MtaB